MNGKKRETWIISQKNIERIFLHDIDTSIECTSGTGDRRSLSVHSPFLQHVDTLIV